MKAPKKPIYTDSISSFKDARGEIWTTFKGNESIKNVNHVKLNTNLAGVFRGFHADNKTTKIATCISGRILSLIVWPDNSKYELYWLDSSTHATLLIPPYFYNGFLSITESIYMYQLSYQGVYNDADQQYTLSMEESCVPDSIFSKHLDSAKIIRSERDL